MDWEIELGGPRAAITDNNISLVGLVKEEYLAGTN